MTLCQLDNNQYFMCNIDDFKFLADMIEHVPLALRARYVFCCAPIPKNQPFVCAMFLKVRFVSNKTIVFMTIISSSTVWLLTLDWATIRICCCWKVEMKRLKKARFQFNVCSAWQPDRIKNFPFTPKSIDVKFGDSRSNRSFLAVYHTKQIRHFWRFA